MARHLDYVLVVDVESTCWERGEDRPHGQVSEIIEVGIAKVGVQEKKVLTGHRYLILPQLSGISPFCTQLTGWTLDSLKKEGACSYREAMWAITRDLRPKDRTWVSWGDYDRKMFEGHWGRNPDNFNPFAWSTHLNLKNALALYRGWPKELGMMEALKSVGIPHKGVHHRGLDDAANIAKLFLEVFL